MKLTLFFRKVMGRFFDNSNATFKFSYEENMKIINRFNEPQDDFERSLFQYKCTMLRYGKLGAFALNMASMVAYPFYHFKLSHITIDNNSQRYDAVFFTDRISVETVPDSLRNRYPNIVKVRIAEQMGLSYDDIEFLKEIREKLHGNFYFHLKLLLKIGMISAAIRCYSPKAIISYTEEAFATSLSTEYCEKRGIQFDCFMHGERSFGLKLPFFRCSHYFAWDEDYVKLFLSMRCEKSQFVIEVPEVMRLKDKIKDIVPEYDLTFYLQAESRDSIATLHKLCKILLQMGYKLCIRPHPDNRNPFFQDCFDGITIQDSRNVSLARSLGLTKAVVAKHSTVIYQAWYNDIPIVFDDLTMPGIYEKLIDLKCVMVGKPHKRLSDLVEKASVR